MTQTLLVVAILLFAVGYLGARVYRTARAASNRDAGCAAGCGCDAPAANSR